MSFLAFFPGRSTKGSDLHAASTTYDRSGRGVSVGCEGSGDQKWEKYGKAVSCFMFLLAMLSTDDSLMRVGLRDLRPRHAFLSYVILTALIAPVRVPCIRLAHVLYAAPSFCTHLLPLPILSCMYPWVDGLRGGLSSLGAKQRFVSGLFLGRKAAKCYVATLQSYTTHILVFRTIHILMIIQPRQTSSE